MNPLALSASVGPDRRPAGRVRRTWSWSGRMLVMLCGFLAAPSWADDGDERLERSLAELRGTLGEWAVTTEFLGADGEVARSVEGTYRFEWVVEDRVLLGRNEIPELEMAAGILFYLRESSDEIEMVSVGKDGKLWVMTGPLGGDTRTTQPYATQQGGEGQLRFTRYNVTEDGFESRMEWTEDGGETWHPGNHQVFRRP